MSGTERKEYRLEFDPSTTSPVTALAEALAAVEDQTTTEILSDELTLQDYFDTEALNMLLTSPSKEIITVSLTIDAYDVQIRSSGAVEILSARRT